MWINYSDSEVNKYHPICEKAINNALGILNLKNKYEVKHHQAIGTLEMDFAIRNKLTGKYLCVIEVKRTPNDVRSTRYQYQAMSYVQMASPQLEKPFYIITNLEYSYLFRLDSSKPRVFQQMLEPGMIYIGNFNSYEEKTFIERLSKMFEIYIKQFIDDKYRYLNTLDKFAEYIMQIKDDRRKWKSSLVLASYEYVRGALSAIGRKALKDIRIFGNDIQNICEEISEVGFNGVFEYNKEEYYDKFILDNDMLTNLYEFGKSNISADIICEILYTIITENKQHEGKVSTDTELARVLAVLSKYVYGKDIVEGKVLDPAAGSGNLINSAINILGLEPNQIIINDKDKYLLELLSLKVALKYPSIISNSNSPIIMSKDIIDMKPSEFNDTNIIMINPPYIAGIKCSFEKEELARRIEEITQEKSMTNVGQAGLEAVFIELITALSKEETVISCIIPKQYFMASGKEAVQFRKFLINKFGLEVIFNYPGNDLFNSVKKDTCIIVGRKGSSSEEVRVFSSLDKLANVDLSRFSKAINEAKLDYNCFLSLMPGIEGIKINKYDLMENVNRGWRNLNSELSEAIEFVNNKICNIEDIIKLEECKFKVKRGQVGNNGANNLLYFDSKEKIYSKFKDKIEGFYPGMRNAHLDTINVGEGDSKFFSLYRVNSESDLDLILSEYIKIEKLQGKQAKKDKSIDDLKNILRREEKHKSRKNSVLVPRNLRTTGKVYINNLDSYISTNFIVVETRSIRNANIIASWMTTIFYQLICEVSAKDQEGTRKMELKDILDTYVPNINIIDDNMYKKLECLIPSIEFVDLQKPEIRNIDKYWAEMLFGDEAELILNKSKKLLKYLSNRRNLK